MNEERPTLTQQEIEEMAEQAAEFARMATEHGAGALVFHGYTGPPPPAEFWLQMMREMIEADGAALGCITVGCGDEGTGTLPLIDVSPVDALHAIVHVRLAGLIPSVNWVTVCSDTYAYETDDPNVRRGTAKEAFERGDPAASEALLALCVAPDGPGYDVQQPYVRTEEGVEWGEKRPSPITSLGDISLLMNELVLA